MRPSFVAAFAAMAVFSSAAHADQVWLTMDQVRPYILEKPAAEIVVGNPAIADIKVQDKTRVLLYGKAPGLTNMYIFDDEGNTVENLVIRVKTNANEMLTMHRGSMRTTYNCTDNCEATITVGDNPESFEAVSTQVQRKQQQAQADN